MYADVCGGFLWVSSNLSEIFELLVMQKSFFGIFPLWKTNYREGVFVVNS